MTAGVPRVTVVVPTMGTRPEWLNMALESVLTQSLAPSEVLVVHNGAEPLDGLRCVDKVRIVSIFARAGAAQARNFGAVAATGDYLAFLDDDDWWGTDYLLEIGRHIRRKRPPALVARLDRYTGDGVVPWKCPEGNLDVATILVKNPSITGSTIVIRRDVFMSVGGFKPELRTSEDKSLILELLLRNLEVVAVPAAQAIRRHHDTGNLSSYRNMAIGVLAFLDLYGQHMSWRQRMGNFIKALQYYRLSR